MGLHMKTTLFALALVSTSTITTNIAYANTTNLDGWWGFDKNGCNDTDNQYRVAIGKWVKNGNDLVFGKGKIEAISTYDDYCVLAKRKKEGNAITWSATCDGEEGKSSGEAKVYFQNENTIKLSTPSSSELGLVRCNTGNEKAKTVKAPDIDENCLSDTVTAGQLTDCRKYNTMKLFEGIDEIVKSDLKLKAIATNKINQLTSECKNKVDDEALYCMFDGMVKVQQELKNAAK